MGKDKKERGSRQSDLDHLRWLDELGATDWQGKSVLDLGCGSGYLCQQVMTQGAVRAVGVDIEPPNVDVGSWIFKRLDLEMTAPWDDALGNAKPENGFDVVLAFDIIEHLTSPWRFLEQCSAVLGRHGQLILTTPNTNSWERYVRAASWSGVQDPQHKILFNKHSLRFLLQKQQFEVRSLRAPIRKLSFLGHLSPQWGAQLLCAAGRP